MTTAIDVVATLPRYLLTRDTAKTRKGTGHLIAVQYCAPSRFAGGWDMCPWATLECIMLCLHISGHSGVFKRGETSNNHLRAQIARTLWYQSDPVAYLARLVRETETHARWAVGKGPGPAFRFDGTSDIGWAKHRVIRATLARLRTSHDARWYEYTKSTRRAHASLPERWPHITLSWGGVPVGQDPRPMVRRMVRYLSAGGNVAAIVAGDRPDTLFGFPTVDGDATDRRYLDPPGHVAVLSPKGRATKVAPRPYGFIMEGGVS